MQPSLTDHIAAAIFIYQAQGNQLTFMDILTSLETIRHELTDEYIKQNPMTQWPPVTRSKH